MSYFLRKGLKIQTGLELPLYTTILDCGPPASAFQMPGFWHAEFVNLGEYISLQD